MIQVCFSTPFSFFSWQICRCLGIIILSLTPHLTFTRKLVIFRQIFPIHIQITMTPSENLFLIHIYSCKCIQRSLNTGIYEGFFLCGSLIKEPDNYKHIPAKIFQYQYTYSSIWDNITLILHKRKHRWANRLFCWSNYLDDIL